MTFEGWKGYVILEKNNLQTVQEWTKSYIELIALSVHPKNSNHLRSHLRAIMTLDHCRLGLENKSGRIFLRSTSSLYKILLTIQIWGRVTQPFMLFIHHICGKTIMRRCCYHTDLGQNAEFHNFAIQIALIQYSGRSRFAWAFTETTI